jgi:hypothetical protein
MLATETHVTDWIRLIRAEYEEMPGLLLTCPQIRRIWGIDCATCQAAIEELVRSAFLVPHQDGAYGRSTDLFSERLS